MYIEKKGIHIHILSFIFPLQIPQQSKLELREQFLVADSESFKEHRRVSEVRKRVHLNSFQKSEKLKDVKDVETEETVEEPVVVEPADPPVLLAVIKSSDTFISLPETPPESDSSGQARPTPNVSQYHPTAGSTGCYLGRRNNYLCIAYTGCPITVCSRFAVAHK